METVSSVRFPVSSRQNEARICLHLTAKHFLWRRTQLEAVIPPRNSAGFGVWKLENQPVQVLRITFFSFAIVVGLIQVVDSRNAMNVDGISYLDMGDAYLRGGWGMLVNGHWSPLYPWLLGVAKALIKPSAYWEFA